MISSVRKEVVGLQKKMTRIVNFLKKEIVNLPENPNITNIKGLSNLYTLPFSKMEKSWHPKHYNFRYQYELIVSYLELEEYSLLKQLEMLEKFITKGKIKVTVQVMGYPVRKEEVLHPEVCRNIKNLLNS